MRERLTLFFASRYGTITAGALIGVTAALLQSAGNPPNMGICIACFERDLVGALGLHRAAPVQYLRPEIPALLLGSFLAALLFGEFRARSGSAPLVRFVLGFFAMVGALAFLGCPWRACLRLAGGDLNAVVGFAGLAVAMVIAASFFRRGYTLERAGKNRSAAGLVLPIGALLLLVLVSVKLRVSPGGALFFSRDGPGSQRAPIVFSCLAGLLIGALAQRTRFCTIGALRDLFLMRDNHLLSGVAGLIAAAFAVNIIAGRFSPGFVLQPIAHSNFLWNFLGMVLAGLAFALAGGCPGRQLILAGEGDGDSALFVLGMCAGGALAHNFALAAVPDKLVEGAVHTGGLAVPGRVVVVAGIIVCLVIALAFREKFS